MIKSEITEAAAEGLSEMVTLRMPIYPSDEIAFGRKRPWRVSQGRSSSPMSNKM